MTHIWPTLYIAAALLLVAAIPEDPPRSQIRWRIRLVKPYDANRDSLIKVIESSWKESGVTSYWVESDSTILLWTKVPYSLDYIAESPEVCSIHEAGRRYWWKPWTWWRS